MTDLRDAAKLALKVLENKCDPDHEAIAALKRALAEDAMNRMAENEREELKAFVFQELAAEIERLKKINRQKKRCPNCASLMEQNTELDKKLSEWVGLTEDEFFELAPVWFERETSLIDFVAMVEAKLKEKNR